MQEFVEDVKRRRLERYNTHFPHLRQAGTPGLEEQRYDESIGSRLN